MEPNMSYINNQYNYKITPIPKVQELLRNRDNKDCKNKLNK